MKGRWAAGIVPRNFAWIVKDRLAVSERPGGYAPYHRKVRRQEEILWLEANGFTRVVSLLPSSHNLHAYEELGLPSAHFGLGPQADVRDVLAELYPALLGWIRDGERLLLHQEELSERVAGVVAGFLCWCGIPADPTRAIYVVEQLLRRQMGSAGRAIVVLAAQLPPPEQRASIGEPAPAPMALVELAPEPEPIRVVEGAAAGAPKKKAAVKKAAARPSATRSRAAAPADDGEPVDAEPGAVRPPRRRAPAKRTGQ